MHAKLDALNFFLADVRGAMGAFVSVFLVSAAGWTAAEVGAVLTVSGLIGIALHVPAGAMIDAARGKRALLAGAALALATCAVAIERRPSGPVVFAADVVMAVLGGVFAPTVAALTLGIVAAPDLARRLARNAAVDRAGNITVAAVIGICGWWFSQHVTFYLVPVFALATIAVLASIPPQSIDHDRARGFAQDQHGGPAESTRRALLGNRGLLVLAAIAATFHFGNAAMLPLVGQKLALAHPGAEATLTAACIVIAQAVGIPVAIVTGAVVPRSGLRAPLAVASLALALRGLAFAASDNAAVLLAAQVLDGVASGIWDALIPLLIADYAIGSGRYSASRGFVGTVQGIGGSISNGAAGAMVALGGYGAAFALLAAAAAAACALVAALPDPEQARRRREAATAVGAAYRPWPGPITAAAPPGREV